MPSLELRYDYQPHCFRIYNTSHTHHPEHALETLGSDDMWRAIMQIIDVNMTHFLPHERQFLSHFPKLTQALSRHSIRSVSKDLLCRAEQQQYHFIGLGIKTKKKKEKIDRERHFRAPDMAVVFKWVTGLTLLKMEHKSVPTVHTDVPAVSHSYKTLMWYEELAKCYQKAQDQR